MRPRIEALEDRTLLAGDFGFALDLGGVDGDVGRGVATDSQGNVYVTGCFSGTATIDSVQLTSAGLEDVYVAKYDFSGALLWAGRIGGPNRDVAYNLAVDDAGNVYATGFFAATSDFDPGPGVFNLSAGSTTGDAFVVKLTSNGDFTWAASFVGGPTDTAAGYSLAVDAAGNVFTSGQYSGGVDFDPGADAFALNSLIDTPFISKLDKNGLFVWAKSLDGINVANAADVALDSQGCLIIGGHFLGTTDFDPGPSVFNIPSIDGIYSAFVLKLDPAGDFLWARAWGGPNAAYVFALAVDHAGNIVTTGQFRGSVDFDPGTDISTLSSDSLSQDIFVSKLDAGGSFVWARAAGAPNDDAGYDIAIDSSGSAYVTGSYSLTVDFDPSGGTDNLTSASSSSDVFVWKLSPGGDLRWARGMGGVGVDQGIRLALGTSGRVLTTGLFQQTADFDPGAGSADLGAAGDNDAFLSQLTQPSVTSTAWRDLDSNGVQDFGEPGLAGVVAELFASTNGTVGDGDDVSVLTVVANVDGLCSFVGLTEAVNYYIAYRLGPSLAFTTPDVGSDDADSDADAGSGRTAMFSLSIGQHELNLDAGVTGSHANFGHGLAVGDAGTDRGLSVAIDHAENVIYLGVTAGSNDFDPGPSVLTVGAGFFVAKYSGAGALIWAFCVPALALLEDTNGLAVDDYGNVYLTGSYTGTKDFDPSVGVFNLNSTLGTEDAFVLKLTPAGTFLWAGSMGGSGVERGTGIEVDRWGNVLTTGSYTDLADFDPGLGTSMLTNAGGKDVFVCKLDSGGDFAWAAGMGGGGNDSSTAIAADQFGSVYTSGSYDSNPADFDPGAGVFNLTNRGVFVSKLSTSGGFLWAKDTNGDTAALGMDLAVDGLGSSIITGSFSGAVDFDPGPGFTSLVSSGGTDSFVWKLDTYGNIAWARATGGVGDEIGMDTSIDSHGLIYTVGKFNGTVDFNPSTLGIANLDGGTLGGGFIQKLDLSGNFQWARAFTPGDSSSRSQAWGVAVDDLDTVYTTGLFVGTVDFNPGVGSANLTSSGGSEDLFFSKLTTSAIVSRIWHDVNNNGVEDASEPGTLGAVAELVASIDVVFDNNDDIPIGLSVTNGNGEFSFPGLSPDYNYFLYFRPPSGFGYANQDVGGDDTKDSDCDPTQGSTGMFTIPAGQSRGDIQAGMTGAAPIFGFVATGRGPDADVGRGVVVDAEGFVYVAGAYSTATDFDLGPANYVLETTSTADNAFMAKYSPNGALMWARGFGNTASSGVWGLAVDAAGNSYAVGRFEGGLDFDPGPGQFIVASDSGSQDIYIEKLDTNGNFVWARIMGGSANDQGLGVTVDATGNVYVTGSFVGTADFDPGPGSFPLTSNSATQDIFVVKLDPGGSMQWADGMGGNLNDVGLGLRVDSANNLFATGLFRGTADFDPSAATFNLTSAGSEDIFVVRLNPGGGFGWAAGMGGTGDDRGTSLILDEAGNVLVTGFFRNTADFDPSGGSANRSSNGGMDVFLSVLNSSGGFVNALTFGGSGDDVADGIGLDLAGNVFLAGMFQNQVDFDPSAAEYLVTSNGASDFFILKLLDTLTFDWLRPSGGTGADRAVALAVHPGTGDVYVTGNFSGTVDFDPAEDVFNLTSGGQGDMFVIRQYFSHPPTMTTVNDLFGAIEDQPFTISHDDLINAADEADIDNDPLSFRIEAVLNGTLTKNGQPVVPGFTMISAGESVVWQAGLNVNGLLPAFQLALSDGGPNLSDPVTVQIDITPVNDEPSFIPGGSQTVSEDSGQTAVPNWATGISRGPADEAPQGVNFELIPDNPSLFLIPPAVSSTGTLTFTPATHVSGSTNVTVRMHDTGGIDNDGDDTTGDFTFSITINAVATPPALLAQDALGNETAVVALTISANLVDTDGSETLSDIFISGVPVAATLSAGINLGGGAWQLTRPELVGLTITQNDNDAFILNVTVTSTEIANNDQETSQTSFTVTFNNVSPTASISNSGNLNEGQTSTVTFANQFDISPIDTSAGFFYSYDLNNDGDFMDSQEVEDSASPLHSFVVHDNGAFIIHVRIADKDGGYSDYLTQFSVTNIAPTASVSNNGPASEGGNVTVMFTGQLDPSTVDTVTGFLYSFDLNNDGDFSDAGDVLDGTLAARTFTYPDNGTFTIGLRIKDKDGGLNLYSTGFTISNVAPIALFSGDTASDEDEAVLITFANQFDPSITDTGAGFLYSYDANNDGDYNDAVDLLNVTNDSQTFVFANAGSYTIRGRIMDKDGGFNEYTRSFVVGNVDIIVTGLDKDKLGQARVRVLDADTRAEKFEFLAYPAGYKGGVRVAVGDVTGDGVPDIICAPGKANKLMPDTFKVKVFDGTTGVILPGTLGGFSPYGALFKKGVYVTAGDVNGDGFADIITGPLLGFAPTIRVFSGVDGSQLTSFDAYLSTFRKGVRVAAADFTDDGKVEIVTHSGNNNKATIKVFDGMTGVQVPGVIGSVQAFEILYKKQVFIAAGDVTGDGQADIIAVAGGLIPRMRIFDGMTGLQLAETTAEGILYKKGLRVGVGDMNGDGVLDIAITTAKAAKQRAHVRLLDGLTLNEIDNFFADDSALYKGGAFISAGR